MNINNKNSNSTRPTQPVAHFISGGNSDIEINTAGTESTIPNINVKKAIRASGNDNRLLIRFVERNSCKTGAISSINSGIICIALR